MLKGPGDSLSTELCSIILGLTMSKSAANITCKSGCSCELCPLMCIQIVFAQTNVQGSDDILLMMMKLADSRYLTLPLKEVTQR